MKTKYYNAYSFAELHAAATASGATQEDIDTLGAWCAEYGDCWNGECYDASAPDEPSGIADEYLDRIPVVAVSRESMRERDERKGVDAEKIEAYTRAWDDWYTEKMRSTVTFPIWGACWDAPEGVFEEVVRQLRSAGTAYLENVETGERFVMED